MNSTMSNDRIYPLGIKNFLEMMSDYHPKWIVIAVMAPVDRVAYTLIELGKAKLFESDILIEEAGSEDVSRLELTTVVQPKNNRWSVIFWGSSNWSEVLSKILHTKAVTLVVDDTSAGTMYEIFENGELLEKADWSPGELMIFESKIRLKPDLDMLAPDDDDKTYDEEKGTTYNEQVFRNFVDDTFRTEGIYLPACWSQNDGRNGWLIVEESSKGTIDRAELVELSQKGRSLISKRSNSFKL